VHEAAGMESSECMQHAADCTLQQEGNMGGKRGGAHSETHQSTLKESLLYLQVRLRVWNRLNTNGHHLDVR
jgi:hypothetical protein